ncbi:MAG TPA: host attachment protein [Verrucomicrobiae bacterium]|nr:host attachment protein [Verrucomicrobiae bacterium]
MNTLLVVADLGGFKAFKIENSENPSKLHKPHLELLEQYDNPQAHDRLVDKVSDSSGRFPRRTGARAAGAMSDGERHNINLEARKRFIRDLANRLNQLARKPDFDRCFLAASKEINHPLFEELDPRVRAKIAKNIPADLTKFGRAEILSRF